VSYDVLTMGRVGVDIYPLQAGVGLEEVETFGKFLGGSATNVAVAAARHGCASAVITRTGADPFGRAAHHAAWQARGRAPLTVLDLDYRPVFWASREQAREQVQAALPHVTVAVGNLEEVDTAVGTRDARAAAAALLEAGVELAVVKRGPDGVYAQTKDTEVEVPPIRVEVVNGIGAGDGFGGALCHGLLAGWPLERIIRFANAAGAIVTTRLECSSAMPTTEEVEDFLRMSYA